MALDVGIDLGTASVLVYVKGKGVLINEPSVVAFDRGTNRIKAIGEEAREMIGRTPGNIIAVRPLRQGVISDYTVTEKMLKYFIKKATGTRTLRKPRISVCIPSGATEVEKKAVEDATYQAGAREVSIIEEPIAAAIGAGIDISRPCGNMIVDIGGGTTEVAVIALGGIVASKSIRIAGDAIDGAIVNYLKKEEGINIGDKMAETIKMTAASAYPGKDETTIEVKGRNVTSGLPKTVIVKEEQIREAISENIDEMVEAIKYVLENTPPELAADIMERGITLTGGGALIKGLDLLITARTKIPTHVAEYPLDCVAVGTGRSLEKLK